MLVIHGRATSSNVQAVMWAVAELGIAHERRDVGGPFGQTDTPSFRAMNPMGRVPVIEDGPLTLFESQAILRYLGSQYGQSPLWPSPLWPEDPAGRARVDQWMEWAKVNVYPTLTYKVFWQLVRTASVDRDLARVAEGEAELAELMTIAEERIARQGWLAGETMSLADISFGTHLYRYFTVPCRRAELPHLAAYYQKLTTRPAYAAHVMVSYEAMRVAGA